MTNLKINCASYWWLFPMTVFSQPMGFALERLNQAIEYLVFLLYLFTVFKKTFFYCFNDGIR